MGENASSAMGGCMPLLNGNCCENGTSEGHYKNLPPL